jgi:hypothetical protein
VTDGIAEVLGSGIAEARERERIVARADQLELELAARDAGLPVTARPRLTELFLGQYEGPADPDEILAAWHRQVLDAEPPAAVTERLRSRDADERIAQYRQALEAEDQSEETE